MGNSPQWCTCGTGTMQTTPYHPTRNGYSMIKQQHPTNFEITDSWSKSILNAFRDRYIERLQKADINGFLSVVSSVKYPPPYGDETRTMLDIMSKSYKSNTISKIDPEMGDISTMDELFYYRYSSTKFYLFDDELHRDTWPSVKVARDWFNIEIKSKIFDKYRQHLPMNTLKNCYFLCFLNCF